MQTLREHGFVTVAMALRDDSVSIDDPRLSSAQKLAVILGSEGDGLASETIADCDYTVKIPMAHGVDSLNVAAASAVAFWELGKSALKNACSKAHIRAEHLCRRRLPYEHFAAVLRNQYRRFPLGGGLSVFRINRPAVVVINRISSVSRR